MNISTNKIKTPLLLPLFFQDDHYLILVISEPQCFRPNWELSEAIVLSKPKVNNGLRRKILLREWFKQIFSRYELSTQKVIISPMQCRHCALGGLITKNRPETTIFKYRTRAIITCSWFETALNYKPRILDPKIEEFPCLVHKLSVTLTALQYKPQWKIG